jgi:hypothetical protein
MAQALMTGAEARAHLWPLSSADLSLHTGLTSATIRVYFNSDKIPSHFEQKVKAIDVMEVIKWNRYLRKKYKDRLEEWVRLGKLAEVFMRENGL